MLDEIITELHRRGATIVKIVDISILSKEESKGYDKAFLIGIALEPDYILSQSLDEKIDHSGFGDAEHRVGELAEWLADYIVSKGYLAYAQSDRNIIHEFYDEATKSSALPHKKIAVMAGLGWIGKSNLLITPNYGSALSMCSVLTNAPVPTDNKPVINPQCGECSLCRDICPTGAIHGIVWEPGIPRDLIVDVNCCEGCLKCLVHCPWTQNYGRHLQVKS